MALRLYPVSYTHLKQGHFKYGGYDFNIVDLPGTYSLSCYSPEELYVRRYLRDEMPDVIINVVVASNLERNLYLTTELIDMDRSMVIALNMYDELERSGSSIDYKLLGEIHMDMPYGFVTPFIHTDDRLKQLVYTLSLIHILLVFKWVPVSFLHSRKEA